MNWTNLYLTTPIPQIPRIVNTNFESVERYLDIFYNEDSGILIAPIETTGKVKGSRGEFVTAVVDNLVVKNQYTNLYDNNTTADYNFYKMLIEDSVELRDPCTGLNYWPYENPSYKCIDVNKPYYKITNSEPIALINDNLSQVVGIYFDSSLVGTNNFEILLDPCLGTLYTVDTSLGGEAYMEFIAIDYDVSWGTTWSQYKYGIEEIGETSSERNKSKIILTDDSSVIWDLNQSISAQVTLTDNRELVIENPVDGDTGILVVVQDASGNHTLTLPTESLGQDGSLVLSTAGDSKDILSFYYDGTNYFWNLGTNYY
jgi:hypothetical protein